jgi:hypothetical protein
VPRPAPDLHALALLQPRDVDSRWDLTSGHFVWRRPAVAGDVDARRANAAAEELLAALVAEGMSRQAAIETLAPAYNTLLVSALQAERFERGNAQVLREAFRLGRR